MAKKSLHSYSLLQYDSIRCSLKFILLAYFVFYFTRLPVIQHVLQYGRVQDRQSLLGIIVAGGILTLSRQKFASNVVEKLLKYGNQEQRAGVVRAMLETVHDDSIPSVSPGGTPIVILMVRDAYANYVVQTAIDVSVDPERRELLNVLNANVMMLRQYTFAKHIVAKLGA